MANETTLTTLTELKLKSTASGLMWASQMDVWDPIIAHETVPVGVTSHILPVIAVPTAGSAVGEATAATAQAIDSGSAGEITISELVKEIDITNHVKYQVPQARIEDVSKLLAEGIMKAKSAAIRTATSTWSQTTGTAGTALSTANFESVLNQIRAAGSMDEVHLVSGADLLYGPKGISTKIFGLSANEYAMSSGTNPDDYVKRGFVMRANGVTVHLDPAVTKDVSDDITGYFFTKDAIAWGEQIPFTVDVDYLVQTRVHAFVATLWGGAKEKIDGYGVLGTFDVA